MNPSRKSNFRKYNFYRKGGFSRFTLSPSHPLTLSHSHLLTLSHSHLLTLLPSHLLTLLPSHLLTFSPSHLLLFLPVPSVCPVRNSSQTPYELGVEPGNRSLKWIQVLSIIK